MTTFSALCGSSDGPLSPSHRKGRGISSPLSLHPPSTSLSASPLSLTISTLLSSFYPAVCDPHTVLLLQSARWYHSRLDLAPSIYILLRFFHHHRQGHSKVTSSTPSVVPRRDLRRRSVIEPILSHRVSVFGDVMTVWSEEKNIMWNVLKFGKFVLFKCLSVYSPSVDTC